MLRRHDKNLEDLVKKDAAKEEAYLAAIEQGQHHIDSLISLLSTVKVSGPSQNLAKQSSLKRNVSFSNQVGVRETVIEYDEDLESVSDEGASIVTEERKGVLEVFRGWNKR